MNSMTRILDRGPAMTPVPWTDVRIRPGFWHSRQEVVRNNTLPHILQRITTSGAIDQLRLDWRPGLPNQPKLAADSDVYKWIEASSYVIGQTPSPHLEASVSELVQLIRAAQQPDGYLNPYYTVVEPNGRWNNLRDAHELYNAEHLIEAGIAHAQATGDQALLDVGLRFARYISQTFGRAPSQIPGYCGHPEIELALLRLFHHTGDRKHLELARYFID